jgi:hypothetical protein
MERQIVFRRAILIPPIEGLIRGNSMHESYGNGHRQTCDFHQHEDTKKQCQPSAAIHRNNPFDHGVDYSQAAWQIQVTYPVRAST